MRLKREDLCGSCKILNAILRLQDHNVSSFTVYVLSFDFVCLVCSLSFRAWHCCILTRACLALLNFFYLDCFFAVVLIFNDNSISSAGEI